MTDTKDSILNKLDFVMLTRNPMDRNRNIEFQLFLSEKEMRYIKMRLNNK